MIKKNPQRVTLKDRELVKTLDYRNVSFPVSIKDIKKIEQQNKIAINVFGYSKQNPYPIRISSEKYDDHLELLLIVEGGDVTTLSLDEEENSRPDKQHYVLIKDFNRFMSNFSKHESKKHFCMHCLQCFYTSLHLENHQEDCLSFNGAQRVEMPKEGSKVYFKNYQKQLPVPFVIYRDFEAITKKSPFLYSSR